MDYLDKEEKEIMESYETEEWVSFGDELKEEIRQAAKNSTLKNKQHSAHRKRLPRHSGEGYGGGCALPDTDF